MYGLVKHACMLFVSASLAQSGAHLTGDQEVAGSVLVRSGNIISWTLMKYFLWSFSLYSRRAVCQFLVKECAHLLVNHLKD